MSEAENISVAADVARAAAVIKSGGVILYPTDTVWGIGCDACNEAAVRHVFDIKGRAESKSVISLVDSLTMLERYVDAIPAAAAEMMTDSTSRPTTVIFDGVSGLAKGVIAPDGSAAFRLTREAYSAELCRMLGRPVVSTSANRSGDPTAATFSQIDPAIVEAADYVPQYRRDDNRGASPSRVVKIGADGSITVIRP